jgi:hypothetical protein
MVMDQTPSVPLTQHKLKRCDLPNCSPPEAIRR